jgi:hypothetical protein
MAATGSWEDVFADAAPGVAETARTVRSLVRTRHPDVVEIARPGERAVSFGFGERKMTEAYAYVMPQRAHLNLGFFRGTSLPDPAGLLEGTGKALRHVKMRAPEDAGRDAVGALIDAARAERAVALGPAGGEAT